MNFIKRALIVSAFSIAVSLMFLILASTPVCAEGPNVIRTQEIPTIGPIYNSIPVLGIGISLSKYFNNVLSVHSTVRFTSRTSLVVFVRASYVGKYESLISRAVSCGIPVIFVGNISNEINTIINVLSKSPGMFTIPINTENTVTWIYGVVRYPNEVIPGAPTPTKMFSIGGNKLAMKNSMENLGKDLIKAYDWALKNLKPNVLPIPLPVNMGKINWSRIPHMALGEQFRMSSSSANGRPYWICIGQMHKTLDYPPYGQATIATRYLFLCNDPSSKYDFFTVHVVHQIVPGNIVKMHFPNSNYQTDWKIYKFSEKIGASYYDKHDVLVDYAPTTISGVTTVTVSLGISAGGGASPEGPTATWSFSISYSKSHSKPDVSVYDYSDFADNTAWWVWKVAESSNTGKYTIRVEPGAVIRTLMNGGATGKTGWLEEYKVRFVKVSGWWIFKSYSYSPYYDYGYIMLMVWRCLRMQERVNNAENSDLLTFSFLFISSTLFGGTSPS